ncbi:MAG TPA: PEP/pyruvate-binding domain-containing protein [Acidimicrobiia bacterium]|nr:PEP/pyruvate-binding domain-containing protein [Acidimicrobiia bacterium]
MTLTELSHDDARAGVLDLSEAHHVSAAGAKASALSRAARAGLPVLPGFVLTPAAAAGLADGSAHPETTRRARAAWRALSGEGTRALVVRSSATTEDSLSSSMAGRFVSVLDVEGWEAFLEAVDRVVASGRDVAGPDGSPTAMAVLVQPQLRPAAGGVAFGADPVTGARHRIVVAAVVGGPDPLVRGDDAGVHLTLTRRGRVVRATESFAPLAPRRVRHELARTVVLATRHFGRPQDVEWALQDGRIVLLQSRPITTLGPSARARGPRYGPGPLAETFPEPLHRLERELWIEPLITAARTVLPLLGTASARAATSRPLIVTPDGRVAADLALFGAEERGRGVRGVLRTLDPRPAVRHLAAAWRIGRLRVALPALARDVVRDADRLLRQVPAPPTLTDDELLVVLHRTRDALVGLHAHEMLTGQLLTTDVVFSGVGEALRLLTNERARHPDRDDAQRVAHDPLLLALVPPRIGTPIVLPATASTVDAIDDDPRGVPEAAALREALRLRVRWMQELGARAALELGRRHAANLTLPDAPAVRHLSLSDLDHLARGFAPAVARFTERLDRTPLPARFRLTPSGTVVADSTERSVSGRGAGGGRRAGVVVEAAALPAADAVLVVRTLDPTLAPIVGGLVGLVAETGSPLSHLAILAREHGVATVVGVDHAIRRFPPGTRVLVDGTTGEVVELDDAGTSP